MKVHVNDFPNAHLVLENSIAQAEAARWTRTEFNHRPAGSAASRSAVVVPSFATAPALPGVPAATRQFRLRSVRVEIQTLTGNRVLFHLAASGNSEAPPSRVGGARACRFPLELDQGDLRLSRMA